VGKGNLILQDFGKHAYTFITGNPTVRSGLSSVRNRSFSVFILKHPYSGKK
jgi:formylmethanofuran dehydrogenase subunit E